MGKNARVNGDYGNEIIDTTGATTGKWNGIKATEDTVLSVCTGVDSKGTAKDFKVVMNWNGTLTSSHGALLVPRNEYITAITLTSGEIVCL